MNQGWSYKNQIDLRDAGKTVLEFYQQFTHSTVQEWTERILKGQILLDGRRITPHTRLQTRQLLVYHRHPWQEPCVPLDLPIVYQDHDLCVINKPSGLPVLPGGQFLEHTVLGQLRRCYPDDNWVPIHRLGRGTSGLLLLARSAQARAALSQQMRDRLITKGYRTLVGPGLKSKQFTIAQPIGKCDYPQLGYLYCAMPDGKAAESHCQIVQQTATAKILEVYIKTGRPHQIRIHLAYHGFPLLGDPLYTVGGTPAFPSLSLDSAIPSDCGYTLHAYHLRFQHPNTGTIIDLRSPLPPSLVV